MKVALKDLGKPPRAPLSTSSHLSETSKKSFGLQLSQSLIKQARQRIITGNGGRSGFFRTVLVRMNNSRNIYVAKSIPFTRQVTMGDLKANLEGYGNNWTSFTTIFNKTSASREEAESWQLGMAIYAQIEAYILQKRIYLANSIIKLGSHAFHRANELLESSGVTFRIRDQETPPHRENDEECHLFKVLKKGAGIDRNSGTQWVYMLSHPDVPLDRYVGAKQGNGGKGVTHLVAAVHAKPNDRTNASGLPKEGRIETPLLTLAAPARISCLSIETMTILAFLCAKNFTRDIEHSLLNGQTSAFGFPRDWFHEFQRLQRTYFKSYLAVKRLKGRPFTPKLKLRKVKKWIVTPDSLNGSSF